MGCGGGGGGGGGGVRRKELAFSNLVLAVCFSRPYVILICWFGWFTGRLAWSSWSPHGDDG